MKRMDLKRLIINATIIFGISFCLGEVLIRVIHIESPHIESPPRLVASSNPKLVYELNPEFEGINSLGMRGEAFQMADLKETFKIAVIGDSHAYSLNVTNAIDSFPSKLEHYLNEISSRAKVKVLNFGVPGYNTAQELEVLKSKVLVFKPDLVILQVTINDTHVCNYIHPKYKWLNALIHKSHLFVYLWKTMLYSSHGRKYLYKYIEGWFPDLLLYEEGLVGTRRPKGEKDLFHMPHPPRIKSLVPQPYHYMLGDENWKKHIKEFATICHERGIPLLATGLIGKDQRDILLLEDFRVYTFDNVFQGKDTRDYDYDPNNTKGHFNEEGSDIIGKGLARYIARYFLDNQGAPDYELMQHPVVE